MTGSLLASLHHLGFPLSLHKPRQLLEEGHLMSYLSPQPAFPAQTLHRGSPRMPCPYSAQSHCLEAREDVYSKTSQVGQRCLLQGGQQRELSGSQEQTLLMAFSARTGDPSPGKGLQDIERHSFPGGSIFKLSGCDGLNQSL